MSVAHGVVAGLFVGGASRRMGTPKPLLPSPHGDGTLVEHWLALLRAQCADVVLVGELAGLGVRSLRDARPSAGPLGGLVSLLRDAGPRMAIAVACDMPYVTPALLARLLAAPPCVALAPRGEPLFSRWDSSLALPVAEAHLAAGKLSLHSLLETLSAQELSLTPDEARELRDWDSPADVTRG